MRAFVQRVFLPLTLPLVSIVVIAVVVLNMSRVLLAVHKNTAPVISLFVAAAILIGCTYFSASSRPGATLNVVAPVVFIFIMTMGGIVALSSQHPKKGPEGVTTLPPVGLTVEAKATSFVNKKLTAAAGTFAVAYQNDDPQEHTLVFDRVTGFKIDNKKGNGNVEKAAITLTPGTYTFFCDIPGHRAAGMEGTLTVTPGAGGGAAAGAPPTTAAAAGGGATTDLTVTALDTLKLDPATLTAKAGTVNIEYDSDASSQHTLAIDGQPSFKILTVNKKGDKAKGSVVLRPGKYTLFCTVDSHRQAGMQATLTVT
jgi:plastocyanin